MAKRRIDYQRLAELYAADVQNWKIALEFGVQRSSVDRMARRMGLHKQRTGPKSGERHPNWKGGRKLVGRYWYIYSPDHPDRTKAGYVLEHRLILEQKLGRRLNRDEVVHHADGNAQNNAPDNLELFPTNGCHLFAHFLGSKEHGQSIAKGMAKSQRWQEILRSRSKSRG